MGVAQIALYLCFRAKCDWRGCVRSAMGDTTVFSSTDRMKKKNLVKPTPRLVPLDKEGLKFFEERGISKQVVDRNRVQMEAWSDGNKFIAFPYFVKGEMVNVKYRNLRTKAFHKIKDCERVFYGLDDIQEEKEVIIVEGEMDKLAFEMAGITNVVSVPDGAPGKVKEGPPDPNDKRFSYLENDRGIFEKVDKIIIATDNDEPGDALAEELARRLGAWKCWRVKWPKDFADTFLPLDQMDVKYTKEEENDNERWARKDANEVLMKDSAEILQLYLNDHEPFPVHGLFRFVDFFDQIENNYLMRGLCPSGFSTGWPGLDEYYRVVPGELTVVSGVPNSGKSEWLDALAVQLAEGYGWNIAFCAMEKLVWDHARQLIEKRVRKPFFEKVHYAKDVERMSPEEMRDGALWISEKFPLIINHSKKLTNVDWILEKAQIAVLRHGIRGLIIDPYNELDHGRAEKTSETDFVSNMLARIKHFAHAYQVHVWLVAHPRQLQNWRGEPPNMYDISGSAHFVNKADAGIVIHRNWQKFKEDGKVNEEDKVKEEDQYIVRIIVRKMRNKAAGHIGEYVLQYDPVSGTYSDPAQKKPDLPKLSYESTSQPTLVQSDDENKGDSQVQLQNGDSA